MMAGGVVLCLVTAFEASHAQAGLLPDSLLYPEYRYYDEPINPKLYLIRPGERLPVVLIGTSLGAISLSVGPEGMIIDQNLGSFDMNGKTLSQARQILLEPLKKLYNCETIYISVGNPYRAGVTVSGAVAHPGTYIGFTSQRVSEIIKQAGGVTSTGSRRGIVFSGGPKPLKVDLDLAEFASNNSANYPIYAGSSIFVPPISEKRVQIVGENPRALELLESDSLATISALAGGGTMLDRPLMVLDGVWRAATETDIEDQAVFQIQPIHPDGRIALFGGVKKPGRFAYTNGLTLSELIGQAGGYSDDADQKRIAIFRRLPEDEWQHTSEIRIPIMASASAGISNGQLIRGDSVFVPVAVGFVQVVGQVRMPGYYPYVSGSSVGAYIRMAGGFSKKADTESISLTNRITSMAASVAQDAIPGDGDQVRVELKLEER